MRLGRLPERKDPRTLRLASYMPVELPRAPDVVRYGDARPSWPMLANDRMGCCAVTALVHLHMVRSAETGHTPKLGEADVVRAYRRISGYDGSPGSDVGCVMLDVLKFARREGWIKGFVRIDAGNLEHVRHAAWMFGGIYAGEALPRTVWAQLDAGDFLSVTDPGLGGDSRIGSLGGHATGRRGFSAMWLDMLTWARPVRETWSHWLAYCDEAWAVLNDADWLDEASKKAPPGFALDQLEADLAALGRA